MLKIEKTVLPDAEQWKAVIEGMRNPLNSWDKSDTIYGEEYAILGDNDRKLMMSLNKGGTEHSKYRRMIPVWVTITAPLYWWKEADTYTVGKVQNSCSTMHKIHSKPIELSDFSIDNFDIDDTGFDLRDLFVNVVADCEDLRKRYLIATKNAKNEGSFTEAERKHFSRQAKRYWKGLIQLLPTSYNQKRTVFLNYEVLAKMYRERKNHKLDEWHSFCGWIMSLPYHELITMEESHER